MFINFMVFFICMINLFSHPFFFFFLTLGVNGLFVGFLEDFHCFSYLQVLLLRTLFLKCTNLLFIFIFASSTYIKKKIPSQISAWIQQMLSGFSACVVIYFQSSLRFLTFLLFFYLFWCIVCAFSLLFLIKQTALMKHCADMCRIPTTKLMRAPHIK